MYSLTEQILLAICKPEDLRAVPYAKRSSGKGNLHRWEIDQHKAAANATVVAKQYALEQQIELLQSMKTNDTGEMSSTGEWLRNTLWDEQLDKKITQLEEQLIRIKNAEVQSVHPSSGSSTVR